MARTAIPVVNIDRSGVIVNGTGVSEVTGDAANDHSVVNDGNTFVQVRNVNASPVNCTFVTQQVIDGQAVADRVESVPATAGKIYGPFPVSIYGTSLEIDVTDANLRFIALRHT